VIPIAELRALQAEWQLRDDVIEKDYALGWLLAGIAADPDLKDTWIFKGGTALRKCYLETYRLSEDLDFSLTPDGPEDPEQLVPIFQRIAAWLMDRCGLEVVVDTSSLPAPQEPARQPDHRGQGRLPRTQAAAERAQDQARPDPRRSAGSASGAETHRPSIQRRA
jgi:hypothetical protein